VIKCIGVVLCGVSGFIAGGGIAILCYASPAGVSALSLIGLLGGGLVGCLIRVTKEG
jgi:hypothetical protein